MSFAFLLALLAVIVDGVLSLACLGGLCPAGDVCYTDGQCYTPIGPCLMGGCYGNLVCASDLCIDVSSGAATTVATTFATTRAATPVVCKDLLNPATGISDCPMRASLCNNAVYYDLMTQQCPLTCNRCALWLSIYGGAASTTAVCRDLLHPATGISDCPARSAYCSNSVYYDLMTQQCPVTCYRCALWQSLYGANWSYLQSSGQISYQISSIGISTNGAQNAVTTCVDKAQPGKASDCPAMVSYCQNAIYRDIMRDQCPKTCRYC